MMKKILAALLCAALLFALAACSGGSGDGNTTDTGSDSKGGDNKNIKIGVILVGDENEGYTYAHIEGIKEAMKAHNISEDQVIWKYTIPENEQCKETAEDLAEQGCTAIFSNSYNHQTYMQQVAGEPGYENITFVAATGDTAANSGLKNFKNCFTKVYESRYVSGIVAGMKLAELVKDGKVADNNKDADGNIKIGYVGAYPYAEVVSGYTAFYLGIKSVVENVVMEVQYTQSWFDIAAEGQAAKALMADGCIIIGQHADSTGAPAEVQAAYDAGTVAYSIGYNVDMLSVAPKAALTSATNVWGVYYTYAFGQLLKGEDIDIVSRLVFMQKMHKTHPVTGTVCMSTAARIPGSIVNRNLSERGKAERRIWIGHPAGVIPAVSVLDNVDGEYKLRTAAILRTARVIMDGTVYVRRSRVE